MRIKMKSIFAHLFALFIILPTSPSEGFNVRCAHLRYPDFNFTIQDKRSSCSVCSDMFRLTFLRFIPYSDYKSIANEKISEVLNSCCNSCPKFKLKEKLVAEQLSPAWLRDLMRRSDIVYPVFAFSKSNLVYGGYFIPFYDPSGAVYITEKEDLGLHRMISACFSLWPLFIIGVSMVMIAGFIGWLLDCRSNKDEFPSTFVRGWWEGIWWSFVTMSTVGYGDKSPKSIPARLFAIAWIYAGIVLCGILTASMTTIIIDNTTAKEQSMDGARVGMLPNRIYDAYLIANNGGTRMSAQWCYGEYFSIYDLLRRLKDKNIDGFLLDKLTYRSWKSRLDIYEKHDNATGCEGIKKMVKRTKTCKKERYCQSQKICHPLKYQQCREGLVQFFREKTVQQEIPHTGDGVAYGIWIKHQTHYNFFRDAFADNQMTFKSELASQYLNGTRKVKAGGTMELFAKMSHYKILFAINGAVLGVIISFGIVYELVRKRKMNAN